MPELPFLRRDLALAGVLTGLLVAGLVVAARLMP